jgi:DNA-3-methyladenine glycosylase I
MYKTKKSEEKTLKHDSSSDVNPLSERCPWGVSPEIYQRYHDTEWGVPLHDDLKLFEFLTLEIFQAGLSWLTILKKRENFRQAFAGFDPQRVARFTDKSIEQLLSNEGIIRNRAKIASAIDNARAFLHLQESFGSFDEYIWRFVEGQPLTNQWHEMSQVPAKTPLAETISRDLKQRGFRFVGPTVIYAHMQATGMVNDHLLSCFRHPQVQALRPSSIRAKSDRNSPPDFSVNNPGGSPRPNKRRKQR